MIKSLDNVFKILDVSACNEIEFLWSKTVMHSAVQLSVLQHYNSKCDFDRSKVLSMKLIQKSHYLVVANQVYLQFFTALICKIVELDEKAKQQLLTGMSTFSFILLIIVKI